MQQSPSLSIARDLVATLAARHARIAVAPHGDVDGLCAGLLTTRALERLGAAPVVTIPDKGEHVHTPSMRARMAELHADGLVVLDMGSRRGAILSGVPTVVLDHHDARDVPDDAIYVNGSAFAPVPSSGLLAYRLFSELVDIRDLGWLAVLATVGDLGDHHPFEQELSPFAAQYKKTHVRETISLLNAARRSSLYRAETAWIVLSAATSPADIARGSHPGLDVLAECRADVKAELDRVARTPPRIAGDVAVIRFSSGAQIHPLIATRWAPRLSDKIVIAINDGYLPGRSNFAVRSAKKVDLLAFLRDLPLGPVEGEFANGHPRATGGSVPPAELSRILAALGLPDPAI